MTPQVKIGLGLLAALGGVVVAKTIFADPRQKVVDAARSQLGVQNANKYWSVVQPGLLGTGAAWCGGFALWALKQAGLAQNTIWQIGKGFTEINGLPRTHAPLPGDIAYFDQPFQHHAIVVSESGGQLRTIDGNQAGSTVQEKVRPTNFATAFYSIAPFLGQT